MATEEFDRGAKVRRWEKSLENPSAALKQVGLLMVSESQRAFRDQKFGGKAWRERSTPNVFGILADFAAGKSKPPGRRFEGRPAGRDTGALASSISYKLVSADTVEVGSNLPYAGKIHAGGKTESAKITESVQQSLWRWLKGSGKAYRKRLGWLLNKKFRDQTLTATLPARPFVGLTKQTKQDVKRVIGAVLMEAKG